jgi:hypothetical protein
MTMESSPTQRALTWQTMVDSNQALLVRKSGHDVGWWAVQARSRAIADELLSWAAGTEGVQIQMPKGYVSLHSPRRKFAQITRATSTLVDVTLRLDAPPERRLEAVKVRDGDPFDRRVRLASPDDVDRELLSLLAGALAQNS